MSSQQGTTLAGVRVTPYWATGTPELVTSIPIKVVPGNADKRVVMSVDLVDPLAPGELVEVFGQIEATSTQGYAVDFCTSLIVADAASAVAPALGVDVLVITPGAGENVANPGNLLGPPSSAPTVVAGQGTHHGYRTPCGSLQVPDGAPADLRYVNLVAWAGSTAAAAGNALLIMQGYGHLSVVRFTPTM